MIGKEKKVKQWLSRMKLAHKMVLGFLGLIALPFTLLSVFSFASVASHYEHQLAQDGQYMLNMVVGDVNEKMDHVEMLMQVLSCNQNLIAFLSHDYNGAVSHEEYTQTVMPLLQGASNAVSPPLERVYLLTKNTTIPEGYSAVYHYDSVPKSIPTELLENGREATWYHAEIYGKDVLYYLCPIVSSVYKNQGYLLAKMQVDELFPEFGMPQQSGVALFLLDEENRPKLSNVTLNSDFRFPQTAGYHESVRYFSTEIQRVPLRVGVALSVSEHGYLQQSSLLILIFVGFLSLLFLSLFFSMIRSINSRLQRYGDEMERIAESGFNGELAVERQDEIGVIGNQCNRVLGRMRVLMQENIQKETAYKDAQLKALLLQINPHFIYNTLDMFAGKLTLDGELETADYICDFAQMIRYNTMTSTELPLEKELEHVINYVNLENWLNGLLAGKTGKPPVEFPHPVFWVAWPFGGEGEFDFRAEKVFAEESSEDVAAFFFRNVTQDAVVLLNTESSREDIVKAYIETCQESCVRQGAGRPCFAVSRPFTRLEEYPVFYKEARYTMAYRMLEPFDLRFSSAQAATEQSRFPRFQARIHSTFQSRNFAELYQLLQKIFCRDFFQEQPFPKEIRRFYVYWESQVQEMASAYHLELEAFPHFSRFASLNEMQEYLQKVLKQMEATVQTATNKYAHILSIAKQYVQNNYNRDISMDEVAEMVSMSYSYFSRVFKEQLHQSFSEYVLSVRMREAKRLMEEDPAIKIKEVAELVGYESVYTFSRAYKQYYHVSPKQDRDG